MTELTSEDAAAQDSHRDESEGSWLPRDLKGVVDDLVAGNSPLLLPTQFMTRSDGLSLVYPGKVHAVNGEPETGKGMLVLLAGGCILLAGGTFAYVDFEDEEQIQVARLLTMGVPADAIKERFKYIRPELPFHGMGDVNLAVLLELQANLVVIDSASEAVSIEGLNWKDSGEYTEFLNLYCRPLARRSNSAVIIIDHPPKDPLARGRYGGAGAAHKLGGVDVSLNVTGQAQFAPGVAGWSLIEIAKDRPGYIKSKEPPPAGTGRDPYPVAELHVYPDDESGTRFELRPPDKDRARTTFLKLKEAISHVVEMKGPMNKRELEGAVRDTGGEARATTIGQALKELETENHVMVDRSGRAHVVSHCRPFIRPSA